MKKKKKRDKNKNYYQSKEKVLTKDENRVITAYALKKRLYRQKRKKDEVDIERKRTQTAERVKKYRQRKNGPSHSQTNDLSFSNRMEKTRAVRRIKNALPETPTKRVRAVHAYISSKSPTCLEVNSQMGINLSEKDNCKIADTLIENMNTFITSTKRKRTQEARQSMNVLTASLSDDNLKKKKTCLAKRLGITPRRLRGGKRIRHAVLTGEKSCFELTVRKTRSDKIPDEVKKSAYEFWLSPENTRTTGNKNDIKRARKGPNLYVSHAIHILEKTQTEVYLDFKKKNPSVKIGQRQFESYKPFFVTSVRQKDRNTCCCRQHVEIRGLFKSTMEYRKKLLKGMNTSRANEFRVYDHLTDIVNETLCPKSETDQFHTKACIDRECDQCGVNNLKFMPEEMDTSENAANLKWECYEYVNVTAKGGKIRRKLQIVRKYTKPGELYKLFKELLKTFPAHQFRASWQNTQFKTLIDNIPLGHAVCVHDFSENFRCSEQEEIQSNYFQRTEISIHVTILYRHAILEYDGQHSTAENPNIVTEQLFVISPDVQHDRHFTHHCQKLVSNYLKHISSDTKVMHEFTDGCSSQYKSRYCMGDVSTYFSAIGYSKIIRNFFETSHAKGPQDAAGGFIKRQADLAILRGTATIQNAQDFYDFGCKKLETPKSGIYKRRKFFYAETIPRERLDNFKPLHENRKIHQIVTTDTPGVLNTRFLACYECANCLLGQIDTCSNSHQIGKHRTFQMSISETQLRDEVDEDHICDFRSLINIGTVVAVEADDKDFPYYLMKVTEVPDKLKKNATDDWGGSFCKTADVVKGLYYDRVDNSATKYRLIRKRTAIVYTVAVKYVCVELCATTYINIPEQLHLDIIDSIDDV